MFKDKAYVCNLCRKVITYSPEEAGKTFPCPFCKSPVTLPSKWARRATGQAPKRRFWPWALLVALAALGGSAAWLGAGSGAKEAVQAIPVLSDLLQNEVTVAPASARVRGSHLSVAVTEVWYGRPDIHDASLNKTEPTQTPVCCVRLAITNGGKAPAAFCSWREAERAAELQKIILTELAGATNSLVSFGPGCAPAGFQPRTEIAPGETAQDLLLFLCKAKPSSDLAFTLPCENLGGKGQLSFRIPSGMVR